MDVFVARQPIFDRNRNIYGYELLFRGGMENVFPLIDGSTATSKLLSSSFFSVGIHQLAGGKRVFINFTRRLLVEKIPGMFPPETLVVEILENIPADTAVVDACRELHKAGYMLALDDFVWQENLQELVALADIIKIDFRSAGEEEIGAMLEQIGGDSKRLLAEKIETHEEFSRAVEMGFALFQGYFFSRPEIIIGKDISSLKMNMLQIILEVNKPEFDVRELEKIINRDLSLSYKLLRYINSAFFRRVKEISSIRQAIILLGEREVRRFVSFVAASELSTDKPNELLRTSITRARFCESLCGRDAPAQASKHFLVGLFSLIDAMLDNTMEKLLEALPLSEEIKSALVDNQGPLAEYLDLVTDYERGLWDSCLRRIHALGLDPARVIDGYVAAIEWAQRF